MGIHCVTTTEIGQKDERALWERKRATQFRRFGIYIKDIQVEIFRGEIGYSGWRCRFDSYHAVWDVGPCMCVRLKRKNISKEKNQG